MFVDLPPIVADTADGADGADGAMGSVFLYGCYPDRPRSQPPLAVKDNLNPEGAEEGLCPAQPSECAGALWPARSVGADLQKVRCASGPLHSVGHDLSHKGRHRVGVNDALDRVAPVVRISGFEGARSLKGALNRLWPRARNRFHWPGSRTARVPQWIRPAAGAEAAACRRCGGT